MAEAELFSPLDPGSHKTLRSWWLMALLMAFVDSLVPKPEFLSGFFVFEVILHLLTYTVLAFIPMIFFRCRKTTFLLAITMAPFGYLLENLHAGVSGQRFEALIVLTNNAGVLTGIAAGFIVRLKSHYKREGNP